MSRAEQPLRRIAELVAFRAQSPRVWGYEHASALRVHPTALSKWEHGDREALPRGMTFTDYLEALVRLKRARGASEAAIAEWTREVAA